MSKEKRNAQCNVPCAQVQAASMEFHRSPLEKLTLTSKTVHPDEPRTADTMTSAPGVTKPSKAAAVGVVDTKLQSSVLSIDLETAALGKYIDEMLKNVPPGLRLRPTPKHDVDEPMEEKAESTLSLIHI